MKELASLVGLSYGTVRVYRATDQGALPPEDVTVEGKPMWRLGTIEAWKEKRAEAAATETD